MKLTGKQRAFAAAYVQDCNHNATQAAKDAGYAADPGKAGHLCLKRPHVQAEIARLEAAARSKVKVRTVTAEVVAPLPMNAKEIGNEQAAVANRAEALAVVTNALRVAPGDFLDEAGEVFSRTAIKNAPPGVLKDMGKDETGDWRLKFSDPIQAARVILDDHARQHGDEDHMAGPRRVLQVLLFEGTQADREAFDELSRNLARLGQNGGGNGDGE